MDPAASPASYYDEDVLYEVESIKDMRAYEGGQRMFLIKWKNYDDRWYVCREGDMVDYGSDPLNTTFIVEYVFQRMSTVRQFTDGLLVRIHGSLKRT